MTDTPPRRRPPTIDEVVRVDGPVRDESAAEQRRSPRIEEVARLAGVSPITVSRALRRPNLVAEEKRRRILAVVEATGYASNPHARALRSGQSTIVAAFVSNIMSPQFALAVQSAAAILEPNGFQLMVGQTSYSYAKETSMIQSLRALRPAAVLFTGVIELESNRRALRELDIPVMETWAYPRDPIDMLVGFSNTDGGRMAADHLHGRGYRRIAYIGRRSGRGALRLDGFRQRVAELGLDLAAELTVESVSGIADGRGALAQLLDQAGSRIDAVFCANDLLAVGALLEARHRRLQVPGELAVIGFGDGDMASEIAPGLTTISADVGRIGRLAGEMLLARLSGPPADRTTELIELDLIQRGST
ncbi:transcriptional regulator [Aliidongia dinghuensis]|uniref:Transcriptional regulator n=1 Tax=Aliidongia dinghuensis TaxID=1867774 RepID=A0A8J2Z272_9PROT|nr:LacI family DNA-binding transcriptional regulator [Aliidongia dinghuensis]GGF50307.1 transcriptional regulator [Aliidongia dinghuensis]